jgi:hypothetical protein
MKQVKAPRRADTTPAADSAPVKPPYVKEAAWREFLQTELGITEGLPALGSADERRKAKARSAHLLRSYGIDEAQWDALYDAQDGKCAICQKTLAHKARGIEGKVAAVDHHHRTGLIRGMTCQFWCNYSVGLLRDSIEQAQGIVDYLTDPPAASRGWVVPKKKPRRKAGGSPRRGRRPLTPGRF